MNLSDDHGPAIVESAQQLLNLSCGTPLSDKMDAIFLSKAINSYIKFLPKYKEVRVQHYPHPFVDSFVHIMSCSFSSAFRWALYWLTW